MPDPWGHIARGHETPHSQPCSSCFTEEGCFSGHRFVPLRPTANERTVDWNWTAVPIPKPHKGPLKIFWEGVPRSHVEHPGAGVSPGRRELESGAGGVDLAERPAHMPTLLPQSTLWARCVPHCSRSLLRGPAHTAPAVRSVGPVCGGTNCSTGTHGVFVERRS